MRSLHARLAPLAVLLVALGGCAPASDQPAPAGPASAPSALPTTSTVDAPAATSPTAAPRVVLRRSGGYAGENDTITVEPDGRWTAVDRAGARRTGRLTPADLDRLRRLATGPGLASAPESTPGGHCADTYAYQLTVGTTTVDWVDCPTAAPPETASALATLLLHATG